MNNKYCSNQGLKTEVFSKQVKQKHILWQDL